MNRDSCNIINVLCLLGSLSVRLLSAEGMSTEVAPGREARTLEFRQEMMRKNAYLGEWWESHDGVDFVLSYVTNGLGVLRYRDSVLPFRWKSNGAGKITLAIDNGEKVKESPALTYDPVKDSIDAAFGGVIFENGFTGDLKFKSLEYSPWVRPMLARYTRPKPVPPSDVAINRAARYEKMVADNDPELKTLNSWSEVLAPKTILSESLLWETVDLEYPRISIRRPLPMRNRICFEIVYGYEGARGACKSDDCWEGRISYCDKRPSGVERMSIPQKDLDDLTVTLKGFEMTYGFFTIEYGKKDERWKEVGMNIYVNSSHYDDILNILGDTILKGCKLPRRYTVSRIPTFEEELRRLEDK